MNDSLLYRLIARLLSGFGLLWVVGYILVLAFSNMAEYTNSDLAVVDVRDPVATGVLLAPGILALLVYIFMRKRLEK